MCHILFHPLHGAGSYCHALQVPHGPADMKEELKYAVVSLHHMIREEQVQGPGNRVMEDQGRRRSAAGWKGEGKSTGGRERW